MSNASSTASENETDPLARRALPAGHRTRRVRQSPHWEPSLARRSVPAAVIVGIAVDQAFTTTPIGAAGSVAAMAAIGAVAFTTRPRRWATVWLALACSLVPWFTVRSSPWLLLPNATMIVGLLALSASGPTAVPTFLNGVVRSFSVIPAVARAPQHLHAAVRALTPLGSAERRAGIGRGLLVAIPLSAILVALLASGDRFFASLLGTVGLGSGAGHSVVIVGAGMAWFGLVVRHRSIHAEAPSSGTTTPRGFLLGVHECTVVLGALCALLMVYVASTLTAAFAGRAYVQSRTGLTYAQYARSGFFQLVAVAVIVLAVVITLRPAMDLTIGRNPLVMLGLAVSGLTIAVVGVSVTRLQTYRAVYGLTMLRFTTTAFALWLGVVLLLVAASLVSASFRGLVVGAVVVSACVALVIVNAANPEALVARENIGRVGSVTSDESVFDGFYLAESLSDDAVPVIVANLDRLSPSVRTSVLRLVCDNDVDNDHGWSWNFSRWQANDARRSVCN
jgi:hypothetical protein